MQALPHFLGVALVIEQQQALEYLLAGIGMNGVADIVTFRKVIYRVEIVPQLDVLPAVGSEYGLVHCLMQALELLDQGYGLGVGDLAFPLLVQVIA